MSDSSRSDTGQTVIDDIIMIVLSLISVFLLFFEVLSEHTSQQLHVLEIADISIAAIFLTEFCIRLVQAENRLVFLRHHWWELLAAIPITSSTTQVFRSLNLLRIVRLIRLLRLIRFIVRLKILLALSAKFAKQTHLVYLFTVAGIIILSGALGFHYLEAGANPNVHSLWDSFWWTIVTLTTVGYGDIYPVTTGGRILAIILMLGGIATISSITAILAAYIVRRGNSE